MPVQINITGDNAAQAHQEFVDLHSLFTGGASTVVVEDPKPRQTRKATETKKEEAKDPVEDKPEAKQEPAGDEVDIPSIVDLRAKASEVGQAGKKTEIKALLDKFKSKSISDVPEEQRVAFMAELDAL